MDEKRIKEVFSDEEYVAKILGVETAEEVQSLLKEKEIDLTIDEIEQLKQHLAKLEDGELSEDELENVAGGFVGVLIGFCVLMNVGALAVCADGWTRRRW